MIPVKATIPTTEHATRAACPQLVRAISWLTALRTDPTPGPRA
jgi:hypothetical protein